jgi:hypothetical protein
MAPCPSGRAAGDRSPDAFPQDEDLWAINSPYRDKFAPIEYYILKQSVIDFQCAKRDIFASLLKRIHVYKLHLSAILRLVI